jgi:Fe-S-cluster containining protein
MSRFPCELSTADGELSVDQGVRRFACTQCGKCCNRSPEVQLSEAAALSDMFVFQLLFRICRLPRRAPDDAGSAKSGAFYENRRLLDAFAARKYPVRVRRDGRAFDYTNYLVISALALDTNPGACAALEGNRCSIYDRRPLACRTVPLHYSRAEALAGSDLDAFVATPGYACNTDEAADIVLRAGRIVHPGITRARADALGVARKDGTWNAAILRGMKADASPQGALPTLDLIEANAALGATAVSMRLAWLIAADAGLMGADECGTIMATQLATIERELALRTCCEKARSLLVEMASDYREALRPVTSLALGGPLRAATPAT